MSSLLTTVDVLTLLPVLPASAVACAAAQLVDALCLVLLELRAWRDSRWLAMEQRWRPDRDSDAL